jgi:hypothetical protein
LCAPVRKDIPLRYIKRDVATLLKFWEKLEKESQPLKYVGVATKYYAAQIGYASSNSALKYTLRSCPKVNKGNTMLCRCIKVNKVGHGVQIMLKHPI